VLDQLDVIARNLSMIATWLATLDEDHAAIRVECAARDLEAAAWTLETPVRVKPSVGVNGQQPPLGG
jgi:hypothetical protein